MFTLKAPCGCSFLEMPSSADKALGTQPELFQNVFTISLASWRAVRVEIRSTLFPGKQEAGKVSTFTDAERSSAAVSLCDTFHTGACLVLEDETCCGYRDEKQSALKRRSR